jgi:amino acid transporter
MILAPPAGDTFNFIVDLQSYPSNVFYFLLTFGLFLIRRRRSRLGIPNSEFRVWNVFIIFSLAVNVFILVMPWYPPPGGRFGGDVNFWLCRWTGDVSQSSYPFLLPTFGFVQTQANIASDLRFAASTTPSGSTFFPTSDNITFAKSCWY